MGGSLTQKKEKKGALGDLKKSTALGGEIFGGTRGFNKGIFNGPL